MNLVFGIGSGRCGTHSLAKLLNLQKGFDVTHEFGEKPALPWVYSKEDFDFYFNETKLKHNSFPEKYFGDVSFYLLPYIKKIIFKNPSCKIICLKRDKESTIKSFELKTIKRNHWQEHDGSFFKKDIWDRCFPKYTANSNSITESKKRAIGLYYDEYYSVAQNLEKRFPENIKIFDTDSLNSEHGITSILSFIGIPQDKMVIKSKIKIKARRNQ